MSTKNSIEVNLPGQAAAVPQPPMLPGVPFNNPEEIGAELDLTRSYADMMPYFEFCLTQSMKTRDAMNCIEDIRVGAREEERIDVFPNPNPKAPILIFVHGGWWLKTTRKHWSYTAYGFVQHGYTVIVSDYTLCPKGRIPDITQANRAAVAWAYEHADEINGDRDRIYLAGHSAGGQQAGMMAVTDWVQHGLPADVLKAVVPLSGIFDMRVIQHSYLNGFVQLNGESVQTQSAILHIPDSAPPIQLMVAEEESTEFHRQAEEFLEAWKAKKLDGSLVIIPDEDHSTYIFEMGHPDSPTCNAVVDFFKKH
ncbi:alpha/beta hydrolase [Roseovarius indicus]|uniref:Carboxylesterase NlhH n=1 Tax=Roseovarius indicus TaxID=540747 RepID=A0A5P3A7F7_9RHOB|nr:alpha/beta hydrolase [Roseovarius indicus]OAN98209.1 hypothetical protein A8B76_19670 [Roseovarius indicus]QEW25342.1 Carboxylesterase NlhH [Roseovarius indicus]SFE21112.1 arylformamidase [Roseovarius indicus]